MAPKGKKCGKFNKIQNNTKRVKRRFIKSCGKTRLALKSLLSLS